MPANPTNVIYQDTGEPIPPYKKPVTTNTANVNYQDTGENIPYQSTANPTAPTQAPVNTSSATPKPNPSGGSSVTAAPAGSAAVAAAAAETPSLSILTGNNMQWFRDAAGTYYVAYKLPNSDRFAFFEATPQQMDALFGLGARPGSTAINDLKDLTARSGFYFSGNIGEVAGTGSFENAVNRSVALALDGDMPAWMKDSSEIWDVLYVAEAEGKSDDWVLGQIRNTNAFQQRFIGIEHFEKLGLSLGDAVGAYTEYESKLKQVSLRYTGFPDIVTPSVVGDLAARGHSIEDVNFVFDIFDRMDQNAASFENFNEILASQGMQPLGLQEQFSFLAGQAPPELYKVWEQNSILTAAEQAQIKGFGVAEALQVARNTPGLTSEAQAFEGMSQAAKYILQFRRELNLGRLEQDDLIDLSLGSAPRSGRSQAELSQEMTRIVREAEAYVQNKVRPYIQFSKTGRPRAASLGELNKVQSVD